MAAKHPKRNERPGVDRAGRTALHYAAGNADCKEVRRLLDLGMDVAAADDDGFTPLHFAAQSNATDVALILLDAGAPVDAPDAFGNTALSRAVFSCRGDGTLIQLLRARGSDPTIKNKRGVSPVKLAQTIANFNVRQFFSDIADMNGE
jgi:ankyrin repeat protein